MLTTKSILIISSALLAGLGIGMFLFIHIWIPFRVIDYLPKTEQDAKSIQNYILHPIKHKIVHEDQQKKLKVIMIIGVEGSGHHFYGELFKVLETLGANVVVSQFVQGQKFNKIMHDCWFRNMWDPSNQGDQSCNTTQHLINTLSITLPNDSLLYDEVASYPSFSPPNIRNIPNMNSLIDFYQNHNKSELKYMFDVRMIVTMRGYVNSLWSSCQRFHFCEQRLVLLSKSYDIIQAQLFSIDPQFWIGIDYDDLMYRPEQYTGILSKWLNIDDELMSLALHKTINPKKRGNKATILNNTWNLLYQKYPKIYYGLKNVFYGKHKYSLMLPQANNHFLVTPEDLTFLNSKQLYD